MRAKQVVAGLGWTSTATLLNLLAQFGFMAILARKLEPAAFGMLAMASVATRFVSYFAEMGGAQTLIQSTVVTSGLTTAGLFVALGVSSVLYAVLAAAAPVFGLYFRSPELVPVLWVFGATLPLTAVGALPIALLRRQARFRATSTIEVLGYVLGYGLTGITLASLDYGFWSLVCAVLMQQTIVLVLAFGAAHYPLVWPVPRPAWKHVVGLGSRYSFLSFLEFLWTNVETFVIGRLVGQAGLGVFNRAQLLSNLPVEQAVSTTSKVLFPALSAMRGEQHRLADGFLVMLLATGIASAAMSSGISAAAPDLVAALLGPKWGAAVPFVQLLAASVAPKFVYVACGITMDSMAALKPKLQLQSALLVVKVLILISLVSWGLTGIAISIVVCEWLRAGLGMRLLVRLLGLEARSVWVVLGIMLAVAGTVYVAVWSSRMVSGDAGFSLVTRLLCQSGAGVLALAMVLCLFLRHWTQFAPLCRFESVRKHLRIVHDFVYRRSCT